MRAVAVAVAMGLLLVGAVSCEVLAWRDCLASNGVFFCMRVLG